MSNDQNVARYYFEGLVKVPAPRHGAELRRPPVVVASVFQTGLNLVRDLERKGVRVVGVDCNPENSGFRSRYGRSFLCPDPDKEPDSWVEFMLSLASAMGEKPVLIAAADIFVSAIADHAVALEPHFTFRPGFAATQALLATKKRQYEVAEVNGLPVPKTRFVESLEEVRRFASEARFPCLIKPVHFREWERLSAGHPLLNQKIALAPSADELEERYRSVDDITPAVVVQEIIEGADDAKVVYLSCYGSRGTRLGHCLVREIRTDPILFGSASVVEPIRDPEIEELCDHFFQKIEYEGLCELELKRDTRDGHVKLIEANPRYSVTADAAHHAGVDLGWLHYLDLIGELVEPVGWNGRHFHHIVLRRDVRCFRSYLDAGLTTWTRLCASYKSPKFFDFDLRDWRPATETIVDVLKVLLYPTYRRFFPKR
jgi:predicted ATP-grasp superfamily ATP-dependent carboligase